MIVSEGHGAETAAGIVIGVLAAAAWYAIGLRRLWARVGRGRVVSPARAACYAGGLLVLLGALASPIAELGHELFSAHMVQHLLLILVAPPLLVAGAPLYVGLWALPRGWRRALGRWWPGHGGVYWPLVVWVVSAGILWFWHLPVTYDLAVLHPEMHALEHLSFVVAAFFFWWLLFRPVGHRMDRGAGILYLFAAGLQASMLGALLTFSGSAWYGVHAHTTEAFGLTPVQDQQLAGLIMWIPAALVYLGACAVLFVQWLEPTD